MTLLVPGVLLVAALLGMALLGDLGLHAKPMLFLWGVAHVAYLVAAWRVLRADRPSRFPALPTLFAVGLLARLVLIPTAPTLSEDVYRYLWDGTLVAHGVNPYPHAPADPALAHFDGKLLQHLNHAQVPTIYPPAAQLLFGATARVSPTPVAWKLLLLLLESALVLALLQLLRSRGLPRERLLLYYWNPLLLVESFGSGHVDLAATVFLVVALALYDANRHTRAGIAFGLAVMTKYVPALLIPRLIRQGKWLLLVVAAVTAAVLATPFLEAGGALTTGLRIYARHWQFNSALYHLLHRAIESELTVRKILAVAGVLAALLIGWRARSVTGAAFACFVSFLLLSPTVFPWYAVPVVALLPLHPDRGMMAFSGLLALSYLPLAAYRATGAWTLPEWVLGVEYGGLAAVWITVLVARLGRRVLARRAPSGADARVDQGEDPHVEKAEEIQNEKR
ncbi:MAG TPA: glycosyltransferase 87 family protein [Candidatus Dormibacteraeota bacterium]|nr:glycosyltransferase 87 family protein [Candidatus Dormibacteraeota bacterium]